MAMTRTGKVLPAGVIADLRAEWGRGGMTVGQCHGCFDILHEGHVHYLRQAAEHVDMLIVSVTAARHVGKGPGRPVFSDRARLSVLAALGTVDYVALSDHPTAVPLIELWRPDFYFKERTTRRPRTPAWSPNATRWRPWAGSSSPPTTVSSTRPPGRCARGRHHDPDSRSPVRTAGPRHRRHAPRHTASARMEPGAEACPGPRYRRTHGPRLPAPRRRPASRRRRACRVRLRGRRPDPGARRPSGRSQTGRLPRPGRRHDALPRRRTPPGPGGRARRPARVLHRLTQRRRPAARAPDRSPARGLADRTHRPEPRRRGSRPPADRADAVRRVVHAWRTVPQRTLVVDDTDHGVAAGTSIGTSAVLIDRTGHRRPDDTTPRVFTLDAIDFTDWTTPTPKEST